jgi:hypothetical protein
MTSPFLIYFYSESKASDVEENQFLLDCGSNSGNKSDG